MIDYKTINLLLTVNQILKKNRHVVLYNTTEGEPQLPCGVFKPIVIFKYIILFFSKKINNLIHFFLFRFFSNYQQYNLFITNKLHCYTK